MKAIVTKYALSSGPTLVNGETPEDFSFERMFSVRKPGSMNQCFYRNDWHQTKRDATDDVLRRFVNKQASLKRQLLKLDAKRDKALKAIEGMELP